MLKEISREIFGHDEKAINKHSVRIYIDENGNLWQLDRTLDGCPPFYSACGPYSPTFQGVLPALRVDGLNYWGSGLSWKKALPMFFEAVRHLREAHQERDAI